MNENQIKDEIIFFKEELFLLSRLSNPYLECPIAWVNNLENYQPDDDVPVSYDGKNKGTINLPAEFYKLNNHGFMVRIRVPIFSEKIMPVAFEVIISSSRVKIQEIRFTWGKITGIASLSFQGLMKSYQSSIPIGFSIDSLVALLTKGTIRQFVMNYAMLTENDKDEIIRFSLFL